MRIRIWKKITFLLLLKLLTCSESLMLDLFMDDTCDFVIIVSHKEYLTEVEYSIR